MNSRQDSNQFESRLRQRLQATPIDLPDAAGPHAAAERASVRGRRRRGAAVSVAAVAVLGGLAPLVLGGDDDQGVNTEFAAPIDASGVELDWQTHEDGLARVNSSDESDDGFYALSTAPGTRYDQFADGNVPRALYRWDGSSWQLVNSEADGGDPLARVSERDGGLYALSTAADNGAPVGSFSSDGGESWSAVPLGDIQPPSDAVEWNLSVSLSLASTADTTVAVVSTRFSAPGEKLFAEDISGLESYTWRTTDDGVSLFEVTDVGAESAAAGVSTTTINPDDPTGEFAETLVRTVTWSELGVADGSALGSTVTTFRADGGTWTPIADGPAPGSASDGLVATDSALLLQTYAQDSAGNMDIAVFHTVDGSAWTPVVKPEGSAAYGQMALAPTGGVLYLDDPGTGEVAAFTSNDLGASWSPIDLSAVASDLDGDPEVLWYSASSGPLGVAINATTSNDGGESVESTMLFSTDLQSWTVTDLDELMPDGVTYTDGVHVGTDHVIVQAHGPGDPDDGVPGPTATLVATPVR